MSLWNFLKSKSRHLTKYVKENYDKMFEEDFDELLNVIKKISCLLENTVKAFMAIFIALKFQSITLMI